MTGADRVDLNSQAWHGCKTSKGIMVSSRCLAKDRTSLLTHGSTQRQANFLPKEPSLLESKKRYTLPPDPSNTRIQGAYADIWQQSAQSWSPVRHPGRSQSSLEFRQASSLASHAESSQTWQQRVTTAEHHRQVSLLCSCHCCMSPAYQVQFAHGPICPTSCCHLCKKSDDCREQNTYSASRAVTLNRSGCIPATLLAKYSRQQGRIFFSQPQLLLLPIVACLLFRQVTTQRILLLAAATSAVVTAVIATYGRQS